MQNLYRLCTYHIDHVFRHDGMYNARI